MQNIYLKRQKIDHFNYTKDKTSVYFNVAAKKLDL